MRRATARCIEDTEWDKYGVGKNPRCDNCMAHCGFEGTAVNDAFSHPLKALKVWLRGPRVAGPMAPDLPVKYTDGGATSDRRRDPAQRDQAREPGERVSLESDDGPSA